MWFYERDFLSFPMRKVAENSLCRLKRNTKHFIMCTLLSGLEFNHPHIKTHITILAYYWPPATACGIDTNNNKCLLIVLHWTPGPISPRIKRQEPEAEKQLRPDPKFRSRGAVPSQHIFMASSLLWRREELSSKRVISIKYLECSDGMKANRLWTEYKLLFILH